MGIKKKVMGSKRDNLVFAETNFTGTHYHDKSYHSDLEQFDAGIACRDEPGTFTFHVYAGERGTSAQPRGNVSGAEIDRVVGCSHAQSLGSFSKRYLTNASHFGFVAQTGQTNA